MLASPTENRDDPPEATLTGGTSGTEEQDGPAPMIVARGVSKVFRSRAGDRVEALRAVDLVIEDGSFISIVGPSGCGKSTFLRLVAGLDSQTSGSLLLNGRKLAGPSPDVGIVFQSATLLPWMTVFDNVSLPLRVGTGTGIHRPLVEGLLEMAGLSAFADKYPYELSGGMQQRAAICRALVRDPKALLLDEPFGALDALTRENMNLELQRIWLARRKTVLMITHSIGESIFLGDRVVVMSSRPGEILGEFRVDLPRPRSFKETIKDPEYLRLASEIRALLDCGSSARGVPQ